MRNNDDPFSEPRLTPRLSVMFLGLSLTNPVLELALDNQPTVKRVIVLSFASVSFSVSVSLTLLVIGK